MTRCSSESCRRRRPSWLVRGVGGGGLVVDDAWFCSAACVEAAVSLRLRQDAVPDEAEEPRPAVRLGTVLLRQGTVTPHQLADALAAQRTSGLRLGAQLQASGVATSAAVLRALSAQSGVKHLTAVDSAFPRAIVSAITPAQAEALGIVPLRDGGEALLVACAAPVPRAAIRALGTLLGREVDPFLVADDDFELLVAAYGRVANATDGSGIVADVHDGARRIAAFAAEARNVSITQVVTQAFTWIRLAATGRTATLLMPRHRRLSQKEYKWLAATTRH
jgi:hypothetical protein